MYDIIADHKDGIILPQFRGYLADMLSRVDEDNSGRFHVFCSNQQRNNLSFFLQGATSQTQGGIDPRRLIDYAIKWLIEQQLNTPL